MNAKRLPKRVALYLRVSTAEQTTRNQRRELIAVAKRHGWNVVSIFEDAGISGARGRDGRQGLDALMKAVAQRVALPGRFTGCTSKLLDLGAEGIAAAANPAELPHEHD